MEHTISTIDKFVNIIINRIDDNNNERKTILPTNIVTDNVKCKDCDLNTIVTKISPTNKKPILVYPINDTDIQKSIIYTVIPIQKSSNKVCDMV